MQFSLLTPPTDAPNRMPISRGLPSASAMAVSTSGVPNAIPLQIPSMARPVFMDADAVALPYQALARFAAVGGEVTERTANLVLAAEAKKREANDTVEIDNRYTDFTQKVEQDYEQLKRTQSDETLIPAFNTMWKTRLDEARVGASNPRVIAGLEGKANSLLRAKSGEVTTTSTQKFVARQTAEFEQTVSTLTDLATNPSLTPAEQAIHQQELEKRFVSAAHLGIYKDDVLIKKRRETIETINGERAATKARLDPMGYLEEASQGGNPYDLDSKRQRTLLDAATNQLRVERADREHTANLARQQQKLQQEEETVALRQAITQNWGPDGPKTSMVNLINASARRVGDDNYKSLLETERIYQALATKPGPKKQSDSAVVGELQAKLTGTRWREVTQDDLLRLLKSEALDDGDHRYFSNKLDQLQQDSVKAKPETEEQKARKKQITDAEKTIEAFIQRGSKFEAQPSEIMARDAVVELHRQAAANPDMDPDDIATQLIAKKIAQYQDLVAGLPYQTPEEVVEARRKGLITKREAERYFAIFELTGKNKPPTKGTTPEPSFFQRFNPFGTPTTPGKEGIRPPTPSRKTP